MDDVLQYIEAHRADHLETWKELLRIPSVSTDPAHKADVQRCAEHLVAHLAGLGLGVKCYDTPGHPVVVARAEAASADAPTVLVYGHYDVQPPDPLDLWESPPFEPTERNGNLYARGATDDKGQMLAHLLAVESWMKVRGGLPLNVVLLIEGEEEIGSPNLAPFIAEHQDILACQQVVVSDTSQFAPGMPAITYGLKGLLYTEVQLKGPGQDLHSGSFGGTVRNPCNALARIINELRDEATGRVRIPGFYDDVRPLEAWEREAWAALPFDEDAYQRMLGASQLVGEEGYTTLERRWGRPTLDVNGIYGGYQGPGAKTIVPSRAGAKISMRLVPDQDPSKIRAAMKEYLNQIAPLGVELTFDSDHCCAPVVVPRESAGVQAACRAIEGGFGTLPVFIREGGSIPIVNVFEEELQAATLLIGFGLPDDNTHSPNEKLCIADFHRGIRTSALLFDELSRALG